jgi:hypothetical protein
MLECFVARVRHLSASTLPTPVCARTHHQAQPASGDVGVLRRAERGARHFLQISGELRGQFGRIVRGARFLGRPRGRARRRAAAARPKGAH